MNESIIFKLIYKDLKINQKPILFWSLTASLGILIALLIPGLIAANIGFSLLMSAIVGGGMHMMMHTVLFEHVKGTQAFIMSLPLSYQQYVIAKLLVNKLVFFVIWSLLSVACLYVAFSQNILPIGSLPMMVMVLLAILPAYSLILSVCIISKSINYIIVATITSSVTTSAYLWLIVDFDSVSSFIWTSQVVWNSTVLSVIATQVLLSIIIPLTTILILFKKKDLL